jgi:hypothetical protein
MVRLSSHIHRMCSVWRQPGRRDVPLRTDQVSDSGFKVAVALAAIAIVAVISSIRFGHTPALPPRPPPPVSQYETAEQLLKTTLASPAVWRTFLETDARAASVPAPSVAEMSKRFEYRQDTARHVLSFSDPKLATAGLLLTLERGESNSAVLAVHNPTTSDLAYRVVTIPSAGPVVCRLATPLALNVMVISRGGTERRTECVFRSDLTIAVSKVEVIELPPLSSWYVQQVHPLAVGLEPRLAKAHRAEVRANCSPIVPQAVIGGLENGDLTWRDLVDFYARHRCETYQFPNYYRAFTSDGQRPLPALPAAAK